MYFFLKESKIKCEVKRGAEFDISSKVEQPELGSPRGIPENSRIQDH